VIRAPSERPGGLLGCLADEDGRDDETVWAFRARPGSGVGARRDGTSLRAVTRKLGARPE
jgi:hypothetical protein